LQKVATQVAEQFTTMHKMNDLPAPLRALKEVADKITSKS